MESQRVNRIPSIFDSDDDDEDSSATEGGNAVSGSAKGPSPRKSPSAELPSPRDPCKSPSAELPSRRDLRKSPSPEMPSRRDPLGLESESAVECESQGNESFQPESNREMKDIDEGSNGQKVDDSSPINEDDEKDCRTTKEVDKDDCSPGDRAEVSSNKGIDIHVSEEKEVGSSSESRKIIADDEKDKGVLEGDKELLRKKENNVQGEATEVHTKPKSDSGQDESSESGEDVEDGKGLLDSGQREDTHEDVDGIDVGAGDDSDEDNENGMSDEDIVSDGNASEKSDNNETEAGEALRNLSGNEDDTCDIQDVDNEFEGSTKNGYDEEMDVDDATGGGGESSGGDDSGDSSLDSGAEEEMIVDEANNASLDATSDVREMDKSDAEDSDSDISMDDRSDHCEDGVKSSNDNNDVSRNSAVPSSNDDDDVKRNNDVPSKNDDSRNDDVPSKNDDSRNDDVPSSNDDDDVNRNNDVPSKSDDSRNNDVPSNNDDSINNDVPSKHDDSRNNDVPSTNDDSRNNDVPSTNDNSRNNDVPSNNDDNNVVSRNNDIPSNKDDADDVGRINDDDDISMNDDVPSSDDNSISRNNDASSKNDEDVNVSRNNDVPSNNDDDEVDDGSDAYVIDLDDSDNSATEASKIEDREDVLDSSSSSAGETESPEKSKPVDAENGPVDVENGSSQIADKETKSLEVKEKDNDGKEAKPDGDVEVMEVAEQTSDVKKRNFPLVRVPVRVEDVFTDSEDEFKGTGLRDTTKMETDGSSVTISEEETKEGTSLAGSSRPESAEPEKLSQEAEAKPAKPRIWISSSLFASDPSKEKKAKEEDPSKENKAKEVDPSKEKNAIEAGSPAKTPKTSKPRHAVHRRPVVGFDLQKCLYALDQGWKRELVYRATQDCSGSRKSDVYYYAPNGKKLRSKVEIVNYITKEGIQNLTIENFTFHKTPLEADEGKELIRYAAEGKRGVGSTSQWTVEEINKPLPAKRKANQPAKSSPTPKRVKVHDNVVEFTTKGKKGPVFNLKKTSSSIHVHNRLPTQRPISKVVNSVERLTDDSTVKNQESPGPQMKVTMSGTSRASSTVPATVNQGLSGPQINVIPKSNPTMSAAKKNHVVFTTKLCQSETPPPLRIFTPLLSDNERQQTFHCTNHCPLAGNSVPSIQCMKCLCLFHGECTRVSNFDINFIQSGNAKFLCPNCYKENKENVNTRRYVPPTPYEPLAHDPTSSETESDDADRHIDEESLEAYKKMRRNYSKVELGKSRAPTPPPFQADQDASRDGSEQQQNEISSSMETNSIPCSVPTAVTPTSFSSANQNLLVTSSSGTSVVSNTQTIGGIPTNQILKIHAPGSSSPRFIILQAPGNSASQTFAQVGSQRPVYIQGTPVIMHGPRAPNRGGPSISPQVFQGVPINQPVSSTTFQPSSTVFQPSPMQEKQKTPPRSQPKVPAPEKKNFLQELSLSYRLLLNVFKYLTAKDLLVTSRVCVMWRDLSYSSSLWQSLRLRNICVKDWELLAAFLERRNTTSIDLRKMVFRVRQQTPEVEDISKKAPTEEESSSNTEAANTLANNSRLEAKEGGDTAEMPCDGPSSKDSVNKDVSESVKESPIKALSPSSNKEQSISPNKEKEDTIRPLKSPSVERSDRPLDSVQVCDTSNVQETNDDDKMEGVEQVKNDDKVQEDDQGTKSTTFDKVTAESDGKSELSESKEKESSDTDEEAMEIDEGEPESSVENKAQVKPSGSEEEVTERRKETVEKTSKTEEAEKKAISPQRSKQRRGSRVANAPSFDVEVSNSKRREIETWRFICESLGTVRCLRSVVLPPCTPQVVHLMLTNCKNITNLTAADISAPSHVQFDPAYLMEAPKLKEIRIGSSQGLSFTTNFNFIKLQELKVLVIKGFGGNSWPYLGTNLTMLHLGPCNNFTNHTWKNIGNMKNLRALWLEDGGLTNDTQMMDALSQLTQLRRLCLFNFTVGSKLALAVKKLTKLERFFVLPSSSDDETMGIQNHNVLAATEHMKFVRELVWAVASQDVKVIYSVDHMHIYSPKIKSYPILSSSNNESDQWPLKLIETVVKRHLPLTTVRVMKLDPAAAARMSLSTL